MSDTQQLIECTAGYAETSVMGTDYQFSRDAYGRFVAEVHNIRHRECLLSVIHYKAVPDVPELLPQSDLGLGGQTGGEALRDDGPTVEQYVAAGYQAVNYPPDGYASRSTAEEIEAAIAAQSSASNVTNTGNEDLQGEAQQGEQTGGEEGQEGGEGEQGEVQQITLGLGGEEAPGGEPAATAAAQLADQQQNNRRRK